MRLALVLAAALALGVPAPSSAQSGAAVAADWSERVQRTREGGYLMGNPAAPMKLVEYGSITCSHCADFEAAAGDEIRDHVRSGRLSFEYRPYIIFPSDPGIFMLLGCQAPSRFFTTVRALYATQAEWSARVDAKEAELTAEVERSSLAAAMPAFVRASGTDALFRANGLSDAQMAACLTDGAAMNRLASVARQGQALGVDGTPTFFLNGEKLEVASWAALLSRLRQP